MPSQPEQEELSPLHTSHESHWLLPRGTPWQSIGALIRPKTPCESRVKHSSAKKHAGAVALRGATHMRRSPASPDACRMPSFTQRRAESSQTTHAGMTPVRSAEFSDSLTARS
mgnify:CR=1 FL=1